MNGKKNQLISIRLTSYEYENLKQRAQTNGYCISDYVRNELFAVKETTTTINQTALVCEVANMMNAMVKCVKTEDQQYFQKWWEEIWQRLNLQA